ncbi:hypothetical protein POTOM_058531 [Populus tomentosa]|uniref:NAC domain-containing protein n=1 Tax=Populus tomentosa TaxID=118781 RepID=A0A8X7XR31_POPTO|nr:hypothetical protein POTOM_058531 [Populus tomentosa]
MMSTSVNPGIYLVNFAGTDSDDGEGYFFSPLHPKYPGTKNGRINRSTRTGSWLAKGKDYEIISQHNGEVIGIRRIFVHSSNEDGIKYVMHEFSIPNQENITPVPEEGSDFENWISSDKSDYNNIINDKDQQTEKSTFDNGETNCLKTSSASVYHFADFTMPEDHQGDPEILPHLQSFSGYDQQDLSLDHDFTLDDLPLMLPEQVNTNNGPAGTSMSVPKDDLYIWLEPLWP